MKNVDGKTPDFNAPVIAGVEITTDAEGRYNLNALHQASGGEKKDGPSYWLALEGTQGLAAELQSQTTEISVVNRIEGRNGGTFAHELLAVSYAGWISPAFQLEVNRAFIESRTKGATHKSEPVARLSEIREVRLQFKNFHWLARQLKMDGVQAVFSANQATYKATGFDMMGALGVSHVDAPSETQLLSATEVGRRSGIGSAQSVNKVLIERGLQASFRDSKGRIYYEPTELGKKSGGVMQDTGKKSGEGVPVRQLRWGSQIIDVLREDSNA